MFYPPTSPVFFLVVCLFPRPPWAVLAYPPRTGGRVVSRVCLRRDRVPIRGITFQSPGGVSANGQEPSVEAESGGSFEARSREKFSLKIASRQLRLKAIEQKKKRANGIPPSLWCNLGG